MRFEHNPIDFNDWQTLHELLSHCFAYMDGIIDPPSSLNKLTARDLQQKANKEILTLVWDDKLLVGCTFCDIRKHVIYVGKIAVAQTHRGQNIARRLMNNAIDLAKHNDKKWLELETRIELTNNHKAFAKMGFVKTSENSHEGFNRPTFIIMRREIKRD